MPKFRSPFCFSEQGFVYLDSGLFPWRKFDVAKLKCNKVHVRHVYSQLRESTKVIEWKCAELVKINIFMYI